MVKSSSSVPDTDQAMALRSGSVARKVCSVAVPFSLYVKAVTVPVTAGGSFTSSTVTVTSR